jgi:hypothetical protein
VGMEAGLLSPASVVVLRIFLIDKKTNSPGAEMAF